jgi:hypothetical protein
MKPAWLERQEDRRSDHERSRAARLAAEKGALKWLIRHASSGPWLRHELNRLRKACV